MKSVILIALTGFLWHALDAKNTISGTISNENGQLLTGATVFVPELNKGTVANTKGWYELTDLPDGKVKIQYSFVGYTNHYEMPALKGGNLTLNIVLHQTAIEAEEIVVSGGYNATQHENAVKTDILKLKPITQANSPNFMATLAQIPGVDMISKGSGVAKPVIRGLSMNDILVLNHGVRFENYQYSSHHPLGIDEFGIEGVEVIKGPASLLYGSDAIGGVINFIKEKPAPIGTVTGDYNMALYANSLGMTNNLGIKGSGKNFFAGVRVGQKTNADYLQGGGDVVPNSRNNELSAKLNGGYTGKIGTFKLYYDYTNAKLGMVEDEAIAEVTTRGRVNNMWYQALNTHLLSSQNKLYFGQTKLELNAAYQNTALSHIAEPNVYEIQMQLATLTYEARFYVPINNQSEYIFGIQGMNQQNSNFNHRETILLPDASTNNYGAFGLLQYKLWHKLNIQTGLRYDNKSIHTQTIGIPAEATYRPAIDKQFGSFSGSLGATYTINEALLVRTNFAAAYRTPNIAELTSNGRHELRFEKGDANLVPEKAYESDLSLHYHRDNLTFDVAGFYNRVNHFIFIAPTGTQSAENLPVYQYRQTNSTLYGGEAGLHLHPEAVRWLHFQTTFATVTGKQTNGDYLPFVPANKLRFELQAEKEQLGKVHHLFASAATTTAFDQNHTATDETRTIGYTLLDLSLGGSVKVSNQMVSVTLGANNLLDKKYIDHLSTLKEVNKFNPGRNISLSITVPFSIKQNTM